MLLKGIIKIQKQDSIEYPLAVDFWGHNEGSGTPCKNAEEVIEQVKRLQEQHQNTYKIKVIDERFAQQLLTQHL